VEEMGWRGTIEEAIDMIPPGEFVQLEMPGYDAT